MSCSATATGCSYLPSYVSHLKPNPDLLRRIATSVSTHASIPLAIGLTLYGCYKAGEQLVTAMSVMICDFFMQNAGAFVERKVGNPFEHCLTDKQWRCIVKHSPTVITTFYSYLCTLVVCGLVGSKSPLFEVAKNSACFISAKISQFLSEKYSDIIKLPENGYARAFTRFCFTFFSVYDTYHAISYFFNQTPEEPTTPPTTQPSTPTTEFSSTKPIIEGAEDGNDWHLDETVENNIEDYEPSNGFDVYEYERKLVEQAQKAREALDVSVQPDAIPMRNNTTNSTITDTEEEFFDALETIQN